jgi:hypothetical protein
MGELIAKGNFSTLNKKGVRRVKETAYWGDS